MAGPRKQSDGTPEWVEPLQRLFIVMDESAGGFRFEWKALDSGAITASGQLVPHRITAFAWFALDWKVEPDGARGMQFRDLVGEFLPTRFVYCREWTRCCC